MPGDKLNRRRALQIMAGTIAGIVISGNLPIEADVAVPRLGRVSPDVIAKAIIPNVPHGRVPRGLVTTHDFPMVTPPPPPPPGGPHEPPGHRPPPVSSSNGGAAPTAMATTPAPPTQSLTPTPIASNNSGLFGRLFPNLPAFGASTDDLRRLASTMIEGMKPDGSGPVETDDPAAPSNNSLVPAGFTYLGQFIDHDLTFDPTPIELAQTDPNALRNFRTPRFDLDSMYGNGPADNPYLYQSDGIRFLISKTASGEDDLPRNSDDDDARALIGDPRNDENLIVSQIHLAFLKYHNRVVSEIGTSATLFEDARRTVRAHYQWIVLHEVLPHFVGQDMVDKVLKNKPQFFHFNDSQPFMPVEFSGAAYRFGHSMVRANYSLNALTTGDNADGSPKEIPIFDPTQPDNVAANDLRGFRRRPLNRQIDWSHFLPFASKGANMQLARAFDTQLSHGLGVLPNSVIGEPPPSLPERNLRRGVMLGLPTGQVVARAMGIPENMVISSDNPTFRFQIGTNYMLDGKPDETVPTLDPSEKAYLENVFGRQTPLWYYILKEAELIGKGRQLGPVGGQIVAEVFIGLMLADPQSILVATPTWQPETGRFGVRTNGSFTMVDLLTYVQ